MMEPVLRSTTYGWDFSPTKMPCTVRHKASLSTTAAMTPSMLPDSLRIGMP